MAKSLASHARAVVFASEEVVVICVIVRLLCVYVRVPVVVVVRGRKRLRALVQDIALGVVSEAHGILARCLHYCATLLLESTNFLRFVAWVRH